VAATPGLPPIQQVAVLTDRRHVLTQDAEGTVLMWDVSTGKTRSVVQALLLLRLLLLLAGALAGLQTGSGGMSGRPGSCNML
jgi:hypothetical protein